jgi:hypothetical protein
MGDPPKLPTQAKTGIEWATRLLWDAVANLYLPPASELAGYFRSSLPGRFSHPAHPFAQSAKGWGTLFKKSVNRNNADLKDGRPT